MMIHRMPLLVLILLLLGGIPVSAQKERQKTYTISGKVTDIQNGESLIGATIYIAEKKAGTVTDIYGNYSLSLPPGEYTVSISYIGYTTIRRTIILDKNVTMSMSFRSARKT
jgi:uncharacterized membrane protein